MNWIKTESHLDLPPKGVRVLISDGVYVVEAHRNFRTGRFEGWTFLGEELLGDITHWKFLPEPPKLCNTK